MRRAWLLVFLLVNAIALAGCGSITVQPRGEPTRVAEVLTPPSSAPSATSRAPSPTLVPTVTVAPSATPIPPTTANTVVPTLRQPEPTVVPTPTLPPTPTPLPPTATTPGGYTLTEYRDPAGVWALQYPADLLKTEELNQDITLFISADRATFAAVDTYVAEGNEYGNTGENMRNRARDTLEQIYGKPVNEIDILSDLEGNWATGITFTTDGGSTGEAVYMQPDFRQGDRRVYGFIHGEKTANEEAMLPLLQAMRASFQATAQIGSPPLLFVQDGAVLEQRGMGPAERIASVPDLGQVVAAASFGDVVLVLDERGLNRVLLHDGSSQLLQQFSGPVRSGQVLISGELAIVAATVDDADAQFGLRTYIGLYDHIVDSFSLIPGTPELEQYTALQPLGLTTDGTGIYVLPRGQDPTFGRIFVLATETGEIVQELRIGGHGIALLSPDRRKVVTTDLVFPGESQALMAYIYDLEEQVVPSNGMMLPESFDASSALLWAIDSNELYCLARDLWRIDIGSEQSRVVTDLDTKFDQLIAISPDGRWLLAHSSTENIGALVDLQAETTTAITFAPGAFVVGWR